MAIGSLPSTERNGHNIFMVSLVWGTHALLLYWEILQKPGNSDLRTQKHLLGTVLPLFKNYPVLVLGDREFHSPLWTEVDLWHGIMERLGTLSDRPQAP